MAINRIQNLGIIKQPTRQIKDSPAAGRTEPLRSVHIFMDETNEIIRIENRDDNDKNCYIHTFDDDDNPIVVTVKPGSTVKG